MEASHPQGGSGEDLFLLPEDLASLISSLGGGGYRERPSSEMTTLPLSRSHMIVGVLAGVSIRDLQTAPNSAACRTPWTSGDPFNEVFGAAELGEGALVPVREPSWS